MDLGTVKKTVGKSYFFVGWLLGLWQGLAESENLEFADRLELESLVVGNK